MIPTLVARRARPKPALPIGVLGGLGCLLLLLTSGAQAAQFTIAAPPGSGGFGRTVTILPNGNIVVVDPDFDAPGPITDVGAVYLYRPTGTLISSLRGSTANDRVGSGGVVVLANGNFVVLSPNWDNGTTTNAGAVTFGSASSGSSGVVSPTNSLVGGLPGDSVGIGGVTALGNGNYIVLSPIWDHGPVADAGAVTFGAGSGGISGTVSAANSLVGSTAGDSVGSTGISVLANGNYVVRSALWDNGAATNAGAATFARGTSGISGVVSPTNSLVGSSPDDGVGAGSVTALSSGNYVVRSPLWDDGATANVGAVTFGSGAIGVSGVVSSANSLVGSSAIDQVGSSGVTALANGHYVVASPNWDNGSTVNAGAVTFGSGSTGIAGAVSPSNSLVGSTADDFVGGASVTALANGSYVVASIAWDHGTVANVGAVTFGSGSTGIVGVVSPSNSLVGGTAGDLVGGNGVTALSNGNYVVASANWDSGATVDAGAVTFGSGISGIGGVITPANSLVGGTPGDQVGSSGVTALSNGNYVVRSPNWDNGATVNAGAATFGPGTGGISGLVSPANSLVGSTANDRVGSASVTALSNGNYVVSSLNWDNGSIGNTGAVTFGQGTSGISGVVSPANSLVGGTAGDVIGGSGVFALADGNYVVSSPFWDNGAIPNIGAVTFGSGTSGIVGAVSPGNSLVGSVANDQVGELSVTVFSNGNYAVNSPSWDNGATVNAGAVTLGLFDGSVVGTVTPTHSVLGTVAGQGGFVSIGYDAVRNQLAVGQPAGNRVVLQRTGVATAISIVGDTPDPSLGGQPVTFTATLSASPGTPNDGQVAFTASTGETCVDATPTPTSAITADYSCAITFTSNGTAIVFAEYTGSITHAYSGSGPESHTTVVDPVFADGFEGP